MLKQLLALMPQEHFLYLGDSINAPYGTKPVQKVRELTLLRIQELVSEGVKAVVVACNTATSAAIDVLRASYPELIIVGIEPALKLAADHTQEGAIAVLATAMTLREEKFQSLMRQYSSSLEILPIALSGLVELIEAGTLGGPQVEDFLHQKLDAYRGRLGGIVLGCTHYPFVKRAIQAVVGPEIALYDGGEGTARETKRRLEEAGLLCHAGEGSLDLRSSDGNPATLELFDSLLRKTDL